MSLLNTLRDAVVGHALKLAGNPNVSKVLTDPRLMQAAMKAMSLGGAVKGGVDKAGRVAAGVFGLATQEEVAGLRATIAALEDTVASYERRGASPNGSAGSAAASPPAPAPAPRP
jgi:hypothetical protein